MMTNKYYAKKVEADGITFDSKREMQRYYELKAMEAAGSIRDLQLQVRYELLPKLERELHIQGKKKMLTRRQLVARSIHYTCDFQYRNKYGVVIEDVKSKASMLARDYSLRKNLLLRMIYNHNLTGNEFWTFNEVI